MSTAVSAMRHRRIRWPWLVLGWFVLMAALGSLLLLVNGESFAEQVMFVLAFFLFGVVGALIVSRKPGNRVGALLLYGSGVTATSFAAGELVTYLVDRGTRDGPVVLISAVVSNVGWVIGIIPVLLLLPQIFPDGHLLSRRWLAFAWFSIAVVALLGFGTVLGEQTLPGSVDSATVPNPLYVPVLGEISASETVISILLLVVLAGSVASLIVRFRRSRGVARQQMKWVAFSLVALVATFLLSAVIQAVSHSQSVLVDQFLSGTAFLSLPVAIGIGVLQYRLYELDVVVKKALIAGTLLVIVVTVYGALVATFGAVASGRESSASLFVIALALGTAFRPVTRSARRFADRLVYGRRATPYEVLTEFSERVGEAYATDDLLARMAQILAQGVGAVSARVWLRVGDRLRPAAAWPPDAPPVQPLDIGADALPVMEGETVSEVRDRGELLGALSVTMPPNDPMTAATEKLVRDLASQAGLALRNVRLIEELKASQRRIVAAQDQERRRLERNIHDGAQQQLVALTVKMRLAQSFARTDAAKTEAMLEQMQSETQAALEDLRDLARGIYPPLLVDKGLPSALEAQARKSPTPVRVSFDGVGRYPPEVEAAVYFAVLEGLQNVAKYAQASVVEVNLGEADGRLTFSVRDDGIGFDPRQGGAGSGLQGIVDRISAADGGVQVRSQPGEGTIVSGWVPVGVSGKVAREGADREPARSGA